MGQRASEIYVRGMGGERIWEEKSPDRSREKPPGAEVGWWECSLSGRLAGVESRGLGLLEFKLISNCTGKAVWGWQEVLGIP